MERFKLRLFDILLLSIIILKSSILAENENPEYSEPNDPLFNSNFTTEQIIQTLLDQRLSLNCANINATPLFGLESAKNISQISTTTEQPDGEDYHRRIKRCSELERQNRILQEFTSRRKHQDVMLSARKIDKKHSKPNHSKEEAIKDVKINPIKNKNFEEYEGRVNIDEPLKEGMSDSAHNFRTELREQRSHKTFGNSLQQINVQSPGVNDDLNMEISSKPAKNSGYREKMMQKPPSLMRRLYDIMNGGSLKNVDGKDFINNNAANLPLNDQPSFTPLYEYEPVTSHVLVGPKNDLLGQPKGKIDSSVRAVNKGYPFENVHNKHIGSTMSFDSLSTSTARNHETMSETPFQHHIDRSNHIYDDDSRFKSDEIPKNDQKLNLKEAKIELIRLHNSLLETKRKLLAAKNLKSNNTEQFSTKVIVDSRAKGPELDSSHYRPTPGFVETEMNDKQVKGGSGRNADQRVENTSHHTLSKGTENTPNRRENLKHVGPENSDVKPLSVVPSTPKISHNFSHETSMNDKVKYNYIENHHHLSNKHEDDSAEYSRNTKNTLSGREKFKHATSTTGNTESSSIVTSTPAQTFIYETLVNGKTKHNRIENQHFPHHEHSLEKHKDDSIKHSTVMENTLSGRENSKHTSPTAGNIESLSTMTSTSPQTFIHETLVNGKTKHNRIENLHFPHNEHLLKKPKDDWAEYLVPEKLQHASPRISGTESLLTVTSSPTISQTSPHEISMSGKTKHNHVQNQHFNLHGHAPKKHEGDLEDDSTSHTSNSNEIPSPQKVTGRCHHTETFHDLNDAAHPTVLLSSTTKTYPHTRASYPPNSGTMNQKAEAEDNVVSISTHGLHTNPTLATVSQLHTEKIPNILPISSPRPQHVKATQRHGHTPEQLQSTEPVSTSFRESPEENDYSSLTPRFTAPDASTESLLSFIHKNFPKTKLHADQPKASENTWMSEKPHHEFKVHDSTPRSVEISTYSETSPMNDNNSTMIWQQITKIGKGKKLGKEEIEELLKLHKIYFETVHKEKHGKLIHDNPTMSESSSPRESTKDGVSLSTSIPHLHALPGHATVSPIKKDDLATKLEELMRLEKEKRDRLEAYLKSIAQNKGYHSIHTSSTESGFSVTPETKLATHGVSHDVPHIHGITGHHLPESHLGTSKDSEEVKHKNDKLENDIEPFTVQKNRIPRPPLNPNDNWKFLHDLDEYFKRQSYSTTLRPIRTRPVTRPVDEVVPTRAPRIRTTTEPTPTADIIPTRAPRIRVTTESNSATRDSSRSRNSPSPSTTPTPVKTTTQKPQNRSPSSINSSITRNINLTINLISDRPDKSEQSDDIKKVEFIQDRNIPYQTPPYVGIQPGMYNEVPQYPIPPYIDDTSQFNRPPYYYPYPPAPLAGRTESVFSEPNQYPGLSPIPLPSSNTNNNPMQPPFLMENNDAILRSPHIPVFQSSEVNVPITSVRPEITSTVSETPEVNASTTSIDLVSATPQTETSTQIDDSNSVTSLPSPSGFNQEKLGTPILAHTSCNGENCTKSQCNNVYVIPDRNSDIIKMLLNFINVTNKTKEENPAIHGEAPTLQSPSGTPEMVGSSANSMNSLSDMKTMFNSIQGSVVNGDADNTHLRNSINQLLNVLKERRTQEYNHLYATKLNPNVGYGRNNVVTIMQINEYVELLELMLVYLARDPDKLLDENKDARISNFESPYPSNDPHRRLIEDQFHYIHPKILNEFIDVYKKYSKDDDYYGTPMWQFSQENGPGIAKRRPAGRREGIGKSLNQIFHLNGLLPALTYNRADDYGPGINYAY